MTEKDKGVAPARRHALETLFGMAAARGIIGEIPELDLVQAK